MSANTIFEQIAGDLTDKGLQKTALSLERSFKPTRAGQLQSAQTFAVSLYFSGHEEQALQVCRLLAREKFNGNHNLWTWIQIALLLQCWIYKNQNDESHLSITFELIKNALETRSDNELKDSINLKARERRMNGSLLKYKEISESVAAGNIEDEVTWRRIHFAELLFIYFMGTRGSIPSGQVLSELRENENRIKEITNR